MTQDASLEGLRSQILDSIKGRKLGLDVDGHLVGVPDVRVPVLGTTANGTTLVSTATTTIKAYGVTLIGSSGTSGATGYQLNAPIPGVMATLFNPTTGYAVIGTSAAGGLVASSQGALSTLGTITLDGKGRMVQLMGLTTALWGLVPNWAGSSIATGVSLV